MVRPLKTKSGAWVRPGRRSDNPTFPGSYYLYEYERSAPADYPKTRRQRDIGRVARWCKKNRGSMKQYECVIDTWDKIRAGEAPAELKDIKA